ncbi:uncharacterized protein LOC130783575 isoform X2 [Actinidia eriantha]|uniref:uncharacterized protein LOC130783575 isoform X2 n=1 Tax=Actinidia eriantha TaxID=165200 RepID=UPI00258F4C60|nr:uncharacterized protein LOC130783575 isoform X2 [Actinidia eriantha]
MHFLNPAVAVLCRNRKQKSGVVEFTPDKSYITESSNFSTTPTPGNAVWDKTGHQLWCPTEEVTIPLKSVRKVLRFKIMRFLGLAAPIGSPFNISPSISAVSSFLGNHSSKFYSSFCHDYYTFKFS